MLKGKTRCLSRLFELLHVDDVAECVGEAGPDLYSLGQRFLQSLRWVLLSHAALPVLWAELGEEESQQPHQLLGLRVKADPAKKQHDSV